MWRNVPPYNRGMNEETVDRIIEAHRGRLRDRRNAELAARLERGYDFERLLAELLCERGLAKREPLGAG